MIYRVKFETNDGNKGYYYTSNRIDAEREGKKFLSDHKNEDEEYSIECLSTPKSKKQWIEFLNIYGSHNDNG